MSYCFSVFHTPHNSYHTHTPPHTTLSSLLEFSDHTIEAARDATQKIKLGALYEEQPAVIIFLRRLGCQICRIQVRLRGC